MKMRKTVYGTMDVDVKYKSVSELIRAWFISMRFIVMRKSVGLTISGKNAGAINVVLFPKFTFTRAAE